MKLLKRISVVLTIFIIVIGLNLIVELIDNLSMGNIYIKYLLFFVIIVLIFYYLIIPIIVYIKRPSMNLVSKMNEGDIKTTKRLAKYYIKRIDDNDELVKCLKESDYNKLKELIINYINGRILEFDKIINRYALSVTTTVMLSPNSLIDGLAVIFANSKMLYELSNCIGLRYEYKEILNLYVKVFFAGTLTGAIEEYDEAIEDIVEEIIEGFNDSGSTKAYESVPYVKVITGSISPIIQASSNYFFITYNGYCFKNYFLDVVEGNEIDFKAIKKKARKEARKKRIVFLKNIPQKFLSKTGSVIKEKSINGFDKIKGFIKK